MSSPKIPVKQASLKHPATEKLLPFQTKAIHEMLHFMRTNSSRGVYNAVEQGCGKTCMSIVTANTLEIKSCLIICPASVILNWEGELKRWSTCNFKVLTILKGAYLTRVTDPSFTCVIISYDMAKTPKAAKLLTSRRWDLLILDEAQKLKKRDTHRTKAIMGAVKRKKEDAQPIWDTSNYRIALSGTPITDCVTDAYPTFSKLLPEAFTNYYEFANRYANLDKTPWGDKYYGIKNAEELRLIIRSKFFVRYTKEEVATDLPPKTFTKIVLSDEYALKVPKSEEEILRAEIEAIRTALETGKPIPAIPTSIAGQRKLQAIKKLPPVMEFIEDMLEQGTPVVVFTYHNDVLNKLREYFNGFKPVTISGSTGVTARQEAVEAFQDGTTNLFIGQIIAAGTGITLTRSSTVVFAEMDWSPANVSQAVDRCHRIGTKHPVNIYYFSIPKSIDDRIINTVVEKTKVFDAMMEPVASHTACPAK